MRRLLLSIAPLATVACSTGFESPEIVLDLRVLGLRAEPPEVLIPENVEDIDINSLPSVELCALVADPNDSRGLSFDFTACPPTDEMRCEGRPLVLDIDSGSVEDPDDSTDPVQICATLGPSPALLEVVQQSIAIDTAQGFGAIDIQVQLKVWPTGNNLDQAVFAAKRMRFGVAIPAERTPNQNPTLDAIRISRDPTGVRGLDFDMPVGRCQDIEPMVVAPDERLGFLPRETAGAREDYLVPTFDGEVRMFTENLSFQFYATHGDWSSFTSGGQRDFVGNEPPLHSYWRAPDDLEEIGDGVEVPIWIVERDERGGQAWFPSCARVVP